MRLRGVIIGTFGVYAARALDTNFTTPKRGNSCSNVVQGLLREDCEYMSSMGVSEMGLNEFGNNGRIWIGDDGPNELTFSNRAASPIIVLIWQSVGYDSSFVHAVQPYVTYSLPNTGDSVVISVGDTVSGAFAALYDRTTTLTQYGQVYNTWGEFTSGQYATINVSREPNMSGNRIEILSGGGCVSNMDRCVFKCHSGNQCGKEFEYYLQDCDALSQDGNPHLGYVNGQPEGGCGGWENGGKVQIDFFD